MAKSAAEVLIVEETYRSDSEAAEAILNRDGLSAVAVPDGKSRPALLETNDSTPSYST